MSVSKAIPSKYCHSTPALMSICIIRDPWWIFTTANLFWNIKSRYELDFIKIVKTSPRFGVLLCSMLLSIVFIILDLLAVTPAIDTGYINPFWKLSLAFKCFTDTVILDDFKTALDKLSSLHRMQLIPFHDQREFITRHDLTYLTDTCKQEAFVEHSSYVETASERTSDLARLQLDLAVPQKAYSSPH